MKNIDFHAHILPCCDHGSDGSKTSFSQLTLAREASVDIICATPHYYGEKENVGSFLERRKVCFERLMEKRKDSLPKILTGAEILAFEGIERLPDLDKLCLENTNILLMEMPFNHWSGKLVDSVGALCESGDYTVVLAHADRYSDEKVERLLEYGALIQLNAESLSHIIVKKSLKNYIEWDTVYALGSDIHLLGDGYNHWKKFRTRHKDLFNRIMENTNSLLF